MLGRAPTLREFKRAKKFNGLPALVYQLWPLDYRLLGLLPLPFLPGPPALESAKPDPPEPPEPPLLLRLWSMFAPFWPMIVV